MMALAGACLFATFTQGPADYQVAFAGDYGKIQDAIDRLHPEYREATEEQLKLSLLAAIQFYSVLTQEVLGGNFDDKFESLVQASHRTRRPNRGGQLT